MAKRRKEEAREHARRARGGSTKGATEKLYDAAGSPAARSAEDDKGDGFRRGGRARKEGGKVEGEHEKGHMGKRARGGPARGSNGQFARGGHVESKAHERMVERRDEKREEHREKRARGGGVRAGFARGGSPYSAAHSLKGPTGGGAGEGHQSEMPKESP